MFKTQLPFWLFTIALMLALTLPTIVQDGMFMDAMLYTAVSKNLGNGIGSFWMPVFSKHGIAGLTTFHEQPPLVFGIQALFFKAFGNSMYTERVYLLFTLAINSFLIVLIWGHIHKGTRQFYSGWIPLVFWIITPVCFWSFSNNMHENTMGIFILLSALFYLKAIQNKTGAVIYLLLTALSIFLATLSKGIPGFFPVALPFIHWLFFKRISMKQLFAHSLVVVMLPLLIYWFLFNWPVSSESLSNYLFKRVLHRINENPTVGSRFYIIGSLVSELLPAMLLTLILYVIFRFYKSYRLNNDVVKHALFFLTIGLAGTAPLMLTLVQKGFYFVPSLPFFAIGLALLTAAPLSQWAAKVMESNKRKHVTFFTTLLLCSVIVFAFFKIGRQSRDKDTLLDVYLIGNYIPENSTISIANGMWNDWSLQCYLIRYFNISVEESVTQEFMLVDKSIAATSVDGYKKIPINTLKYELYERKH